MIKIIKDYIDLIFIAAVVGLMQFISQRIGFFFGADFSYLGFDMGYYSTDANSRVQSWFYEPSFLVYAFMPVVFIALARFFNITKIITFQKAIIITLVFILSRSAVGFFGLLLSLILITSYKYSIFKRPKIILAASFIIIISGIFTYRIPDIKFRVDDTVKLFFDKSVSGKDVDNINLSTYALFSNYKITLRTFKSNPFLGTGIGTYEYNYDKYLVDEIPKSSFRKYYKINRNDANSMFFRILAESGLLGILLIFYLLLKNRINISYSRSLDETMVNYWLISNGIFMLILIRLLRQGHYTMLGFTLFLLMYFYANKMLNERDKKTY